MKERLYYLFQLFRKIVVFLSKFIGLGNFTGTLRNERVLILRFVVQVVKSAILKK